MKGKEFNDLKYDDFMAPCPCPDRRDLFGIFFDHCWHEKPIQSRDPGVIVVGCIAFSVIEVKCCFCGGDGFGMGDFGQDPKHGKLCGKSAFIRGILE